MVGTYRGMQVRDSARELGRLTTRRGGAVHFHDHLADALFAVLFVQTRLLMPTRRMLDRVRGVVNRFGGQVVHEGLDMEVYQREIFGIIGGSGAGKSVLLRTILGLRRPECRQRGVLRPGGRQLARRRRCSPGAKLRRDVSEGRVVQLA